MFDRDDDNDEIRNLFPKTASAKEVDELKTITYLLNGLYSNLKQEQEAISLATGQMRFSTEQFKEHMERIETFEQAFRKYVVDTVKKDLQQSAELIAAETSKQVREQSTATISQMIDNLQRLSGKVEYEFDRQVREVRGMKLRFAALLLAASSCCGILGGLIVRNYLLT